MSTSIISCSPRYLQFSLSLLLFLCLSRSLQIQTIAR